MVSEREFEGEKLYICDICGFGYREEGTARRCEEYCEKHHSCSIEITKDAVYFPKPQD